MESKGLYIYGFIPANHTIADRFRELGLLNVFSISCGKISAIVAHQNITDFRVLPAEMAAKRLVEHQKTLELIMSMGEKTLVPMRLGTFLNSESDVLKILRKGYDLIVSLLAKAEGMVEVNLISAWADMAKELQGLSANSQVVDMKESIMKNKTISQADQLAIGFLLKKLLDDLKASYADKIANALNPLCKCFRLHDISNEQVISSTAFLVSRAQLGNFEEVLDKLDETLNGRINFKMVGPLPCYSFYTLEMKELHHEDIEEAKIILGLSSAMSAKNIKHAYHEKIKSVHPDSHKEEDSIQVISKVNMAYHTMMDCAQAMQLSSYEKLFPLYAYDQSDETFVLKVQE